MSNPANDWGSEKPEENITLADAHAAADRLNHSIGVQVSQFYVNVTKDDGSHVSEAELRANTYMAPMPVNLWVKFAYAGSADQNFATFLAGAKDAAHSGSDPFGSLAHYLAKVYGSDQQAAAVMMRAPAIVAAIEAAAANI